MKKNRYKYLVMAIAAIGLLPSISSCNKFLDIAPESSITPDLYFNDASQMESYLISCYDWFPTHPLDYDSGYGFYTLDNNTDNQTTGNVPNKYLKGFWKVPNDGNVYSFNNIYKVNYFLGQVLPKWKEGKLTGNKKLAEHYIGEAYFFRAYAYYQKLVALGDFPIVKSTLPNLMDPLVEASKRSPRNEVARFILSDLDSAATLMFATSPDGGRNNRLSAPVANLLKSRVALFEASWLTNFNNTAFVPNGPDWPGKSKEFTANYSYPSGSIESEIDFFLAEAMKAGAAVADEFIPKMSVNNLNVPTSANESNDYYWMFCESDMSKYPEIMLWREYSTSLKVTNEVNRFASTTSAPLTRGMIKQFLDVNGMPWYAPTALWKNDDEKYEVRGVVNGKLTRDSRAALFIKEPGQELMWKNSEGVGGIGYDDEPWYPTSSSDFQITGYAARKGLNPDRGMNYQILGTNGSPIFRSAEALLNYIEAAYMLEGTINATAAKYWNYLRNRAGITTDYSVTVAAMNPAKEALYDWGAYSAGVLVDNTTMAIRKERRSEFISESRRMEDLIRWRALDQLIDTPYYVEGMRLWNSKFYNEKLDDKGRSYYVSGVTNSKATVSGIDDVLGTGDENGNNKGEYIKIHRVSSKNTGFNGIRWSFAHYLSPIELEHFKITSPNKDVAGSTLYQNPYWPTEPNLPAIK